MTGIDGDTIEFDAQRYTLASFDTSESSSEVQPVKVEDKLKKSKPVIPEAGDTPKNPLARKSKTKNEPESSTSVMSDNHATLREPLAPDERTKSHDV